MGCPTGAILSKRNAALFAAIGLLWFVGLEYRALFIPDEGRYGTIAWEMVQSGDWVTPRLNGLKYFEKPPLQYWATAAAYSLFSADEWTTRLWPALTGFLGMLVIAFGARRLSPGLPAERPLLVTAGCAGYFLASQIATLDMGLTFFLTLAMVAFILSRADDLAPAIRRRWMLLCWAAMALAVLSKGAIGVALPAMALVAYAIVQRDAGVFRGLYWREGVALLALLALPWFVLVQLRNPEFFRFFFIHEHVERFLTTEHHRAGPIWYFVPVMVAALLPWTPRLPATIAAAWRTPGWRAFHPDRFLILWAAVTFVFFSVSQSKLPLYILPALPALLLLLARDRFLVEQAALRPASILTALFALGLSAVSVGILLRPGPPSAFAAYTPWLDFAGITLIAGSTAVFALPRLGQARLAALALGCAIATQAGLSGMHSFDQNYSAEKLMDRAVDQKISFPAKAPFYSVATFDSSLPFYLGRPVTLVRYRGEMAPGIDAEPQKFVPTLEEFRRRWSECDQAFAVMTPALYTQLQGEGLPARVVLADERNVIVARR